MVMNVQQSQFSGMVLTVGILVRMYKVVRRRMIGDASIFERPLTVHSVILDRRVYDI